MKKNKLGLVLSGGGACGAYEAGVIRALAKMRFHPHAISGASIGALNGAIVASTKSLVRAAKSLEILWDGLDREKILQMKSGKGSEKPISLASLQLILSKAKDKSLLDAAKNQYSESWESLPDKNKDFFAVLDETPIETILKSAINFGNMAKWKEFYVSVFPGSEGLMGAFKDIFHWMLSDRESEFLNIRSLLPDEAIAVLKASAAIPIAYPGQKIRGQIYRDGGLGGRANAQGNTPIEPIIRAGCTHAIVIVLDDDTKINPSNWPGIKLALIKPSTPILHQGDLKATFNFDPDRIKTLLAMGEEDALQCRELVTIKEELMKGRPLAKLADLILGRKISS